MIKAFVFIEAEPTRVQELVPELAGMVLASSVIREVHAITGRYDLVAFRAAKVAAKGRWTKSPASCAGCSPARRWRCAPPTPASLSTCRPGVA